MIIFYNYKNLSLCLLIAIFIFSISIFSCESLYITGNRETDLTELHIKDIFQEDSLKIPGYNYDNLTIYSVLQEMFEEIPIRFFMAYSDDDTMQELMKEIAIIESAEKAYSFSIKKAKEITEKNGSSIEAVEKSFILFSSVKQLLINCLKNIDPLKEEIEQIIEEKRWDMEYEEEEDFELFFDIIKLENGISYLNKIKRTLSNNIVEISRITDKTETNMKHYSN